MTHSTQDPIPLAGDNHKAPLKRLLRYYRNRRFRAAARNLQIEDDRDRLATLDEEIDDDHRQYFAEIELAANPTLRAFRRSPRLHSEIIHTARLARR